MLNVPFANGAISTEIAPFPDWNRGLGIAFEQSDGKPEMKGLNGLFQVLTTSMLYLKQRGIAEWDATLEYPANAFVVEGARLYKSKRVNTSKQPSLSQLDWDVWASISDISVSTNGNLKKTVAADGSMTLEVPTATDSQRGAVRQATSAEVANGSNVNAYVTPKNVVDMFVGGFKENDSVQLPNGLIIQWGLSPLVPDESVIAIGFSKPFPNKCLNIQLTVNSKSTLSGSRSVYAFIESNSMFSIANDSVNSQPPARVFWQAIGY